jgi:hypothetical protein
MPKNDATRKVKPIPSEPFCFMVESWSEPDLPRRVELVAFGGNGACDCPDFTITRRENIKRGAPLFSGDTMCGHIFACRDYLINEILKDQSSAQLNPDA